jgi:CheY-like chemotaxis protein
MNLENMEFEVRSIVEEVAGFLAERAQSKGLDLCCIFRAGVPARVAGDAIRLRQILTNLVGNAVKFTERGEVVVTVSAAGSDDGGTLLRFTVSDTGVGIPAEARSRLFQSFSQVDGSHTRKYGGTGLGLAISKSLVEMMDGQIGVESAPGKGSHFWFEVRLEDRPAQPQSGADGLSGMRVLVADGQAASRDALRELLSSWRMKVDCAETSTLSLEMLRAAVSEGNPYHLAILDRQMPNLGGIELADKIGRDPELAGIPVVLTMPMLQRLRESPSANVHVAGYLTKPFRQSQLYDCLASVLDASATNAADVPQRRATRQMTPGLRVLVAEDNEVNQKLLVWLLEKSGCRVDVAANGLEALAALNLLPYDLVLMDVQMPEMDGFEATREIRDLEKRVSGRVEVPRPNSSFALAHSITGRMPIIALTANAMKGDEQLCLDAGMDAYVTKPVRPEQLLDAIEKFAGIAEPSATCPG